MSESLHRYMDDPITAISAVAGNVQSYNTDTFPLVYNASEGDIAIVFVNSDSGEGFVYQGLQGSLS